MAQIMDLQLNLMLLRGKLLSTSLAETLEEGINKYLELTGKIFTDREDATRMVTPVKTLTESIIYNNASEHSFEANNYVATSDLCYLLYEQLSKLGNEEKEVFFKNVQEFTTPETDETTLQKLLNENVDTVSDWLEMDNGLQSENRENIIDNLKAILKSQEFLFKYIIKLIDFFENDNVLTTNTKLEEIKQKIIACIAILGNKSDQKFSNLAKKLNDEEVTRCRSRHDRSKTGLKTQKPEEIKPALDTLYIRHDVRETKKHFDNKIKPKLENFMNSQIINVEIKTSLLKRAKSEPVFGSKNFETILKETEVDIEQREKLIQVKKKHDFTKVGDSEVCYFCRRLLTDNAEQKTKVLENNLQKTKFYPKENRRRDINVVKKNIPSKKNKEEMKAVYVPPVLIQHDRKKTLKDQGINTVISGNDINRIAENRIESVPLALVIQNETQNVVKSRQILPSLRNNKEINTIVNAQTLNDKQNLEINGSELNFVLENSQVNLQVFSNVKVLKNVNKQVLNNPKNVGKMSENIVDQVTSRYFEQTLRNSDLGKIKNDDSKPTKMKLKNKGCLEQTPRDIKKIDTTKPETPKNSEKTILINNSEVIYVNKEAFDDLNTTRADQLLNRNLSKTTVLGKNSVSNVKNNFSCNCTSDNLPQEAGDVRNDLHKNLIRYKTFLKHSKPLYKRGKTFIVRKSLSTFLKSSKSLEKSEKTVLKTSSSRPKVPMLRTTKNAMKREQIITKKKFQLGLVETDKMTSKKIKQEDKEVCL